MGHGWAARTKCGQVRRTVIWRWYLINFREVIAKLLIRKDFLISPTFLWITLLISLFRGAETLVNQGFPWSAQKKSKKISLYKSSTYKRYGFHSGFVENRENPNLRSPRFVHK
jgi:hypothetical protein